MVGSIYKDFVILSDLNLDEYITLEEKYILLKKDFYALKKGVLSFFRKGKYLLEEFDKIVIDDNFDKEKFLNSFIYKSENFIFISKLKVKYSCEYFETNFSSIKKAEDFLVSSLDNAKNKEEFILIFNELFLNSYEHGNLNLTFEEKAKLIEDEKYIDFIKTAKNNKNVKVCVSNVTYQYKSYLICKIEDEGKGFEFTHKKSLYNGRGIKLVQKYCEAIFYNKKRNLVLFIKEIL